MEVQDEFWEWIGRRIDKKRTELDRCQDGSNRYLLKTEIAEAEVIACHFAELFGYTFRR
jgi:hypothetical protein